MAGEATAAVTPVNAANRAGNRVRDYGRPSRTAVPFTTFGGLQATTLEAFKKRQKEKERRLERQRDEVAKRMEIKARKAVGVTSRSHADSSTTENTVEFGGKVDPPARV